MVTEDIYELIKQLLHLTYEITKTKLKEGKLIPAQCRYEQWKMKDFKYGKEGVTSIGGMSSEIAVAKDWTSAIATVKQEVLSTELATKVQNQILAYNSKGSHLLSNLVSQFILGCLNEQNNSSTIDETSLSLVKQLKGEPIQCKAIVQLMGVATEPQIIDLKNGVIIRQTKREDIETPVATTDRGLGILNYPSSVMELSSAAKQPVEIQSKIDDAINILKLYKVGSVRFKSYKMYSHAVNFPFPGILSTIDNTRPNEIYFIREDEIPNLQNFWRMMEDRVSKLKTLSTAGVIYSDIAYARYEDALMHVGVIERRVTDCMMGLESIFLRDGGEQQELSYRLRLRIAKIMSLVGFNPFEVKKLVKDAYEIRSKFVHGGLLDYDGSKQLMERYGNQKNLLLQLLDYLRVSIIISLLVNVEKAKLIDLIDDSFLDKKSETGLEQIMLQTKNALGLK